ncbi:uncharacterized protein LOC131220450 [Magnolia sinica]|uniref:uncharacterized protein LOC131220450 n=1 Tax=Magnolia sinica TaxID=86752 RepID=UPI002658FB4F|nr:uncharacterized protein LOC131220450 [Magnolia sinica]
MLPRLDKVGQIAKTGAIAQTLFTPSPLFLLITITAIIFQIWLKREIVDEDISKYGTLLFTDDNSQCISPTTEPINDGDDPSGSATDNQTTEVGGPGPGIYVEHVIDLQTRTSTSTVGPRPMPEMASSSQTVNEVQVPRTDKEFQITCGVIGLSTAIFGVYAGILGSNKQISDRMVLFEVSVWLLQTSLLSGMLMLTIIILRPGRLVSGTIFYGIMSIAVVSLTYAICFGIYFLLPKSTVRLVIVSVLPAALFFVAMILHFVDRINETEKLPPCFDDH